MATGGMKVLVVGGGGREHALVWALARSPSVAAITAAPGNVGIGALATLAPVAADDVPGLLALATDGRFDLVVVGPEGPLAAGLADALVARGIAVFGCSRAAAEVEASKSFAKGLLARAGVATARAGSFTDERAAAAFIAALGAGRVVVKADGLAAGKGVEICDDAAAARRAVAAMLSGARVGRAGARVVVEEFLVGREASCMALVDGERFWPLAPCEDHKALLDGDRGPMTGGMGAISPTPVVDAATEARVAEEVFAPTLRALVAEGRSFRGILYAGLMLTDAGPRVLEFNCRFGDPETQPLLARLDGDLGALLHAVATGGAPVPPRFRPDAACSVVMVSAGYPASAPPRAAPIEGLDEAAALEGVLVLHAGTRADGDRVLAAGGRVLSVTATGPELETARRRAYEAVARIRFEGAGYRRDIGARPSPARPARRDVDDPPPRGGSG